MKIKALRKFLFLDTDTIADYLAALEGSVLEGAIHETEEETRKRGLGADATLLKAHIGSQGTVQTQRKRVFTPAAQFQHLYELLKAKEAVQHLEAFDAEIWDDLERDEVLEVEASIKLPEAIMLADGVKGLPSLVDAIEPLKDILGAQEGEFEAIQAQASMMRAFSELANTKQIPILFEATGNQAFHFAAWLPRQYLRSDIYDLQGEATILGKVQRFVSKGNSETLFSLDRGFGALRAHLNRKQRRALAKRSTKSEEGLVELLKGPAIVLFPIAIYR